MGPSAYPQTRREFLHHAHVIKIEERDAGLHRSGHRHFVAVGQQVIAQGEAAVPTTIRAQPGGKPAGPSPATQPLLKAAAGAASPISTPPRTSHSSAADPLPTLTR